MTKHDKINYNKGMIYKLVCNDLNIKECYVGSTTNFIKRKYKHKSDCNNEKSKDYNFNRYNFIRNNGGWENWSMVLVENFNCESKRELEQRERFWFEKLKSTLNSHKPYITEEENKEYHEEYHKEYRDNNKKQILKQRKEYYEKKKKEILEHNKEYRDNNKEQILKQKKEYYEKNKKKLKEKYNCVCGSILRLSDKSRHKKSKKHLLFIKIYFDVLRENKIMQ